MIKNFIPRLAEIGKIKIGGKGEKRKSKGGKDYQLPVKFDHFVVTTMAKDNTDNFVQDKQLMELIKDNPKEIEVILPYDDIDLNFLTSYAFYVGKKCVCRGDGVDAERTTKDGKVSKIKCDTNNCEYIQCEPAKCKPNGILSCILPKANKVGGVYKFRTTSWYSVQNIISSLIYISTKTNGIIAGITLKLYLTEQNTKSHGNVPVVNLMSCEGEQKLLENVVVEIKRRNDFNINIKQIESNAVKSGITNDNDDPEDIEDEFYNKNVATNSDKAKDINVNKFETGVETKNTTTKDSFPVEKEVKDLL
jgi:hypothetical protein